MTRIDRKTHKITNLELAFAEGEYHFYSGRADIRLFSTWVMGRKQQPVICLNDLTPGQMFHLHFQLSRLLKEHERASNEWLERARREIA